MNSRPDSVTAVVPVYIRVKYLEECLRSIVKQTRPPEEILVVDDGSPKPIEPFLRALDFFDRLTLLRLPRNRGIAGARNAAMQAAKGYWLAYLDSDDRWHPRKLEIQLAYLEQHPECGGVDTFMRTTYANGRELVWGEGRRPLCLEDALKSNQIFNQALLVQRSALIDAGGYDTRIKGWDDHAISIRLAERGCTIHHIPEALVFHHRHTDNQSGKAMFMAWDGLRLIWRYRSLYRRTLGWRCFPAQAGFVLRTVGRKRGKILGRALRYMGSALGILGAYREG
jgi:GT2 family glycosyltransferase